MRNALLAVAALFLLSCGHLRPPPVPINPGDSDQCIPACNRMAELGCPEGEPLADGTTCAEFCIKTQQEGHALNPTCLAKIQTCGDIEACSVNREGGK